MSSPAPIPERLETPRLILRPFTMSDLDDVWAYASDPEVTRYTIFDFHQDRTTTEEYLSSVLTRSTGDSHLFALEHRETHRVLGGCSIRNLDRRNSHAEMGYALARAYWNQGYATEAVRAVIAFGFRELDLNRVEAKCVPQHTASWRVMHKAGMTYEGILRQAEFFKGKFQDLAVYSILRSEWNGE